MDITGVVWIVEDIIAAKLPVVSYDTILQCVFYVQQKAEVLNRYAKIRVFRCGLIRCAKKYSLLCFFYGHTVVTTIFPLPVYSRHNCYHD